MEKKTIGRFIAILRKANGMTQKELAEKLNVSDKTISHWERDETAPDLSVIPVIAEIFNITSDELLRGEKAATPGAALDEPSPKAEKQIKRLISKSLTQFKIQSLIAAGLAGTGLIAAMICNFGFNRAYLGFFISCIFYLGAAICEIVFAVSAFSAVAGDDFDTAELSVYKKSVFELSSKTIYFAVVLLGATFPLIIMALDAYLGLTAAAWLINGLIGAAAALIVCFAASLVITGAVITKGTVYPLDEKAKKTLKINNSLKIKISMITAVILAVTFVGQHMFSHNAPLLFIRGTTFNSFAEFKQYIETPKNPVYYSGKNSSPVLDSRIYSDNVGQSLSEDNLLKKYGFTHSGDKLYEYVHRNLQVVQVEWTKTSPDYLPVTVYTSEDIFRRDNISSSANPYFGFIYAAELFIAFTVYFKKRTR